MISINEAEEILKKEYHRDNFLYLLTDDFLPDYKKDERDVIFNNTIFTDVVQLGMSKKCDVVIFEVGLNENVQNRRVAITQEMFRILRGQRINNALVAFYNTDKKNYRISLLTSKYEFDGDKIKKVISNPRRYSYYLGYGTKTNTTYKYLIGKGKVNSIDDLISRFSVETVNKQFYNEIALCFTELVGGNRDGKEYKPLLKIQGRYDHKKYSEFAVRLIGRIVFCWFLKEKKSKKHISLIPDNILSIQAINENYYHTTLEPLFFEILNTEHKKRKDKFGRDEIYKKIPYLNGGLFSPHDDDHYQYSKVTESGIFGIVTIPDKWFKNLFSIFEQYNFTVDENTTYDVELSIDPEMLGRIFENLLAEINPETGESAKKMTGSFYTPREIVEYMVDNSLLEYLQNKTSIERDKLDNILKYSKDEVYILSDEEKKNIINALYSLTILDPACGSGAFPIGMLQKIVYILQEIDPNAKLWFEKAIDNILIRKEIEKKFSIGALDFIRKLGVIQKSIFGVDIQPIAVEISRLRCFLSLIIEEKVNDNEDNRGINPLPNLEFKFVIANTLIRLEGDNKDTLFEDQDHIKKLKEIRDEYFNANYERREELKIEFSDIQKKMVDTMINHYKSTVSSRYKSLLDWSPFNYELTEWFEPEWMFGVNHGFDIVIGNPPYIKIQNIDEKQAEILKNNYKSAIGKFDIYVLFIEKSFKLINKDGICVFIQPHRFINSDYGNGIRNYLISTRGLSKFIHFGVDQVFGNVTTYTGIFFYKLNNDFVLYCKANTIDLYTLSFKLKDYESLKISWSFEASENDILNKIFGMPNKVLDIFKGIYQGVITVGDDIFILEGDIKNNIFIGFSKEMNIDVCIESELMKPLLKGEDIKRYRQPIPKYYIFYPHVIEKGKTVPINEGILKKEFPLAYKYILNFKNHLIEKKIKYKTNPLFWYSLHRSRNKNIFETKKIITPQLQNISSFAYDENNCYPDAGGYSLIPYQEYEKDLFVYYAIFNSSLFYYFIKSTSTAFNNEYYYFKTAYIEPFKFPDINDNLLKMKIIKNIEKIHTAKKTNPLANTISLEKDIDNLVYELYGLTNNEIAIIEGNL